MSKNVKRIVITTSMTVLVMIGLFYYSMKPSKKEETSNTLTITQPGEYDVNESYEKIYIDSKDVILKNADAKTIVITSAVGDGDVTLDHIRVREELNVEGGGINSIHLQQSNVEKMKIQRKDAMVRVVVDKNSVVKDAWLQASSRLEVQGEIKNINIQEQANGSAVVVEAQAKVTALQVNGMADVEVHAPIAKLVLQATSQVTLKGSVEELVVLENAKDSKVFVEKEGKIQYLATQAAIQVDGEGEVVYLLEAKKDQTSGSLVAMNRVEHEVVIVNQGVNKEAIQSYLVQVPTDSSTPPTMTTPQPATTPNPPATPTPPKQEVVPPKADEVDFADQNLAVLVAYKERKQKEVVTLFDVRLYDAQDQSQIMNQLAIVQEQIQSAASIDEIDTYILLYQTQIRGLKTVAQKVQEQFLLYQGQMVENFEQFQRSYQANDYLEPQWNMLLSYITAGREALAQAKNIEEVDAVMHQYHLLITQVPQRIKLVSVEYMDDFGSLIQFEDQKDSGVVTFDRRQFTNEQLQKVLQQRSGYGAYKGLGYATFTLTFSDGTSQHAWVPAIYAVDEQGTWVFDQRSDGFITEQKDSVEEQLAAAGIARYYFVSRDDAKRSSTYINYEKEGIAYQYEVSFQSVEAYPLQVQMEKTMYFDSSQFEVWFALSQELDLSATSADELSIKVYDQANQLLVSKHKLWSGYLNDTQGKKYPSANATLLPQYTFVGTKINIGTPIADVGQLRVEIQAQKGEEQFVKTLYYGTYKEPTYQVSQQVSGDGTLHMEQTQYEAQEQVVVTTLPAPGKIMGEVKVKAGTKNLAYERDGDLIRFTMPSQEVSIEVNFVDRMDVNIVAHTASNSVLLDQNSVANFGWFAFSFNQNVNLSALGKTRFALSYEYRTVEEGWQCAGSNGNCFVKSTASYFGFLQDQNGVKYGDYLRNNNVPKGLILQTNEVEVGNRLPNFYETLLREEVVEARVVLEWVDSYGNKYPKLYLDPVTFTNRVPNRRPFKLS